LNIVFTNGTLFKDSKIEGKSIQDCEHSKLFELLNPFCEASLKGNTFNTILKWDEISYQFQIFPVRDKNIKSGEKQVDNIVGVICIAIDIVGLSCYRTNEL